MKSVPGFLVASLGLSLSLGAGTPAWAEVIQPLPVSKVQIQVIYGEDNRKDLYQETDSAFLRLADSTVALMERDKLHVQGATTAIDVTQYGAERGLCRDEPFFTQSTGAFCSGSLVAPNLVLTAGHCIREESCKDAAFVFGYAVHQQALPFVESVRSEDVYFCKEVVTRKEESEGPDYALVLLDRVVADHAPLPIRREGTPEVGEELVVIGHPSGLPTKISAGATVRTLDAGGYLVANLDTYGGNSGSAVFNTQTGLIEGVLVRGETDFRERESPGESCTESNRCENNGCRGEDVTLISEVAAFIPVL